VKISQDEVRYVADLANLSLSEIEVHKLQADLDEILGHIERLKEIDTEGVEPMAQVLYEAEGELRPDSARPSLGTEVALGSAPQPGHGYFKVPKVIER
jgi:aspartyl-tRNA(Asn)/glutamyl-tRNA(Gln) amidotransferase subunit C